jgi:hypothetical protein
MLVFVQCWIKKINVEKNRAVAEYVISLVMLILLMKRQPRLRLQSSWFSMLVPLEDFLCRSYVMALASIG